MAGKTTSGSRWTAPRRRWNGTRKSRTRCSCATNGQPHKIYTRAGGPYLSATAAASGRIPSGHPEGYLEAFANIYTAAYDDMARRASGQKFETQNTLYPNVADGVDGMNFITQAVASSQNGGQWLSLKHALCRG